MDKDKQNHWLNKLFNNGGENKGLKMGKSFQWIILIALVGAAIMILSSFIQVSEQVMPYDSPPSNEPIQPTASFIDNDDTPKTMQDYEKLYENQLIEVLTDMLGIDKVTVKVNLDSTEIIEVEKNRNITNQTTKERDKQGGSREIEDTKRDEQVVLYQNNGNEHPLILKTLKPKVRGVVIVAKGAENAQVKAMIAEAVQKLLDVPPHEIGILPMRK